MELRNRRKVLTHLCDLGEVQSFDLDFQGHCWQVDDKSYEERTGGTKRKISDVNPFMQVQEKCAGIHGLSKQPILHRSGCLRSVLGRTAAVPGRYLVLASIERIIGDPQLPGRNADHKCHCSAPCSMLIRAQFRTPLPETMPTQHIMETE